MQKRVCSFFSLNSEEGLPNAMTFLCSLLSNIVLEYHWVVAHDGSEVEQIGKGEIPGK
jgi:hypothetical protein